MMRVLLPALQAPRISIAICSFNHARFLDQVIQSALDQTYPCEVVVVDDGSTDHSPAVLAHWADRVKVVTQANGGQVSAYQRAYDETTGDVLIFLDSDDFLDPTAAAQIADAFAEGVAKVHYRMRVVDENGQPLGATIPRVLAHGEVRANMLGTGVLYASAPGSGNAYRRAVLDELFPLPADAEDRHGADLFLVYGSVFGGTVAAIPEALANYRVHATGKLAAESLVFGNAEHRSDAWERFERRLLRFRAWITLRISPETCLPERFYDFGTQKAFYARAALNASVGGRLRVARDELPNLLRSVWGRDSDSFVVKAGLTVWALLMLLLPARMAWPLARRVCNPASRTAAPASTRASLAYVYAGYMVRYVSLLILIPFYGRVLGAEAYGQVLAAMSLYAVVYTLVSHGFAVVGARDVACNTDRASVTREFGRHVHGRLLMALAGVAVGVLGTWVSPALAAKPVMGVLATVLGLSHAANLGWFYQGLSKFKLSISLEVFGFLLSLVMILALVRDPADNWLVLLSLCVSNVLANVIAYTVCRRFLDVAKIRYSGGLALIREATPVFLVGGVATLAVGASSYILSLYASVVEVGYFGSAERIAAIVVALMMPANQVFLSAVSSRLHSGGRVEEGYALMRTALRGMLGFSVLATIAVAGLAPFAIPMVLGDMFEPSVRLLQMFALMYPFVAFTQVVNMYVLIPMRLDKVAMKVAAAGTVLNLTLLVGMAAEWHGPGAAWARVIGEVFMATMLVVTLLRQGLLRRLLRAD